MHSQQRTEGEAAHELNEYCVRPIPHIKTRNETLDSWHDQNNFCTFPYEVVLAMPDFWPETSQKIEIIARVSYPADARRLKLSQETLTREATHEAQLRRKTVSCDQWRAESLMIRSMIVTPFRIPRVKRQCSAQCNVSSGLQAKRPRFLSFLIG